MSVDIWIPVLVRGFDRRESDRGGRVIICDTSGRCGPHAKFLPSIETNLSRPTYRKNLNPIVISHVIENISPSL